MEYEDILRSIPEIDGKPRRQTPYKPPPWKGFTRSLIRTRSRCLLPENRTQKPNSDDSDDDDDDDNDDDDESPSPTLNPAPSYGGALVTLNDTRPQKQGRRATSQDDTNTRPNIQDRMYCTHKYLHGLAFGGPIDKNCPNFRDHDNIHINQREFLHLTRNQLAVYRGRDTDCMPLYLLRSRGSLFKFRLLSHGYTLVAKGIEIMDTKHLHHENSYN